MIEVATKISKEERVGVDQRYIKSHFEYDNGRMIRKKGDSPGAKVGHWEWSINRDGPRCEWSTPVRLICPDQKNRLPAFSLQTAFRRVRNPISSRFPRPEPPTYPPELLHISP